MINVTRLNDTDLVLNCHLIESMEANPDTIITMTTGKKFMVQDSIDEVIKKTIEYNRRIYLRRTECLDDRGLGED